MGKWVRQQEVLRDGHQLEKGQTIAWATYSNSLFYMTETQSTLKSLRGSDIVQKPPTSPDEWQESELSKRLRINVMGSDHLSPKSTISTFKKVSVARKTV